MRVSSSVFLSADRSALSIADSFCNINQAKGSAMSEVSVSRMSATTMSVSALFSKNIFEIPDYQRHYAWRESHCRDMFDDIIAIAGQKTRFMGYLTLIELGIDPIRDVYQNQYQRMLVVDGQQRLTSIVLLLSAIIHVYKDENKEAADNWRGNYLNLNLDNGQSVNRLWIQKIHIEDVNEKDVMREYFKNIVSFDDESLGEVFVSAQRRLRKARDYFVKRVREYKEDGHKLADLYGSVTSRVTFVANTISDAAQAGDIFEGLNNRGKKLSPIENIKSYASYIVHAATDIGAKFTVEGSALGRKEILEDINYSASKIFQSLDRLGPETENLENELLYTAWSLIRPLAEQIGLTDIEDVVRNPDPVTWYRTAFDLRTATMQDKRKELAETIVRVLRELAKASVWFADVKRPKQEQSFQDVDSADRDEVRLLCQRLLDLDSELQYLPIIFVMNLKKEPLIKALRAFENIQTLFIVFEIKFDARNRLPVTFSIADTLYRDVISPSNKNGEITGQYVIEPLIQHFYRRIRSKIGIEAIDGVLLDKKSCDHINGAFESILNEIDVGHSGVALILYEALGISALNFPEFRKLYKRYIEELRIIPERGVKKSKNALKNALPEGFGQIELADYQEWRHKLGNCGVSNKLLKAWKKEEFEARDLPDMAFSEKMKFLGYKEEEWSVDFAEKLDRKIRDDAKKRWRLTVDFAQARIKGTIDIEPTIEDQDIF